VHAAAQRGEGDGRDDPVHPRDAGAQAALNRVLICGDHVLDAIAAGGHDETVTRSVVILGYAGVQGLDVVGPFDVFTGATMQLAAEQRAGGYDVRLVSLDGRPIATMTGLEFVAAPPPDPREPIDTVVIPGGFGVQEARRNSALVEWIRTAAGAARRIVTVCSGAFLAAEAGLLDGRTATTHWAAAGRLAREFPAVTVDPEPIFVRSSGQVWTAAGVTAGIDLALHLVEADHGTETAQTVARWLVLYLRRPGGQTQFAAPVWMPRAKRAPIREVQEAIEAEPGAVHSVSSLAQRAAMSPRHFTRLFTEEVGEAPGAYVERIRTDAARRQLEETDDTVTVIAARCGFGSAESLRRNFVRRVGISPDQYRKSFS
jgi:transcriptional regulator GlxA family with amidase domain